MIQQTECFCENISSVRFPLRASSMDSDIHYFRQDEDIEEN
jgi:hypothetical protein